MGVSPRAFQQQDRHVDAQLRMRGAMLKPHAWGFTEFLIDEQYLNLGKVVLSKAAGMLPDGTLFEIGHGQPPLSLDIVPGLTGKRIMLALPMAVEGGAETRDEETSGLSTRYIRTPCASATTMLQGKEQQRDGHPLRTLRHAPDVRGGFGSQGLT